MYLSVQVSKNLGRIIVPWTYNKCSTGQSILVVTLTTFYWFIAVITVFTIMYYQVGIGYFYAVTYYYSVVDILLSQLTGLSNELYTAVTIMSSIANVTPQFLGQLCLIKNMSGIDQQLIHYVHPLAVSLVLIIISWLAKHLKRFSAFVSRVIIHAICFLLLLSYTSVATTSLLLMRSLTFADVNNVILIYHQILNIFMISILCMESLQSFLHY